MPMVLHTPTFGTRPLQHASAENLSRFGNFGSFCILVGAARKTRAGVFLKPSGERSLNIVF